MMTFISIFNLVIWTGLGIFNLTKYKKIHKIEYAIMWVMLILMLISRVFDKL